MRDAEGLHLVPNMAIGRAHYNRDDRVRLQACDRPRRVCSMPCKLCHSVQQGSFHTEINIHFPGRQNLDKPTVLLFPTVMVCLVCGFSEFIVPEGELRMLAKGITAA